MRRRLVAALALLAACEGGGSEIGPTLRGDVPPDWRIVVQDQDGRPISSAHVVLEGVPATAATNRSGRASVIASPGGVRRVTVDGSFAIARDGDRFAALTVAAQTGDGAELPWVFCLPDLAPSAGLTLNTGTQPIAQTLDDSATSGAILTLAAGTSVGFGSATSVTLETGALPPSRLPPGIPTPATGARHTTRAVLLAPSGVTFAPAGTLSLPNELGLADAQPAELWQLDPMLGTWSQIGSGTAGGGRIVANGAIPGGGLYCFARIGAAGTTLVGRILDSEGKLPRDRVLVRADGQLARTDGDGRFRLGPLASSDGAGDPRTVTLTWTGGRNWRPRGAATDVLLQSGTQDVGELRLETTRAADLRLQLISRGEVDAGRVLRASSTDGLSLHFGAGDDDGVVYFEDVDDVGIFGLQSSHPLDREHLLVARAAYYQNSGARLYNVQIFSNRQGWWIPRSSGGQTTVYVCDRDGTGPVRDVAVIRGETPEQGLHGYTNEFGVREVEFGTDQATVHANSGVDGRLRVSATTFVYVDTARLEMPVERVRRTPIGTYDRHGRVVGTLLGSGQPGRQFRVRATRRLALQDWYDLTMLDRDYYDALPRFVDPQTVGGDFYAIGVPAAGDVTAVEGLLAGTFTPERIGFRTALPVVAGAQQGLDLPLDLPCDTDHYAPNAFVDQDPLLPDAAFTYDLALEQPNGRLLDVARDVDGVVRSGATLHLRLPRLAGRLAGARWHAALVGRATAGNVEYAQRTWIPFASTQSREIHLMPLPQVLAPAPDATVPASGFTVRWVTPKNALYMLIELRTDQNGNARNWMAVVPGYLDSFTFRRLPAGNPQVLEPGRTWRLRVSAMRVGSGFIGEFAVGYQAMLGNYVGLHESEREVDAISSTEFTVTTN